MPTTIEMVLIAVNVGVIIWLLVLSFFMLKQKQFFQQFTRGISKKDLKTVLGQIANALKSVDADISRLNKEAELIRSDARGHLQKVGFVRYNPFSDTGGDQSFSLCLLNEKDNGILITSLHSRELTRIYAKKIKAGKGEGIEFSKEEQTALKEAVAFKAKG